MKSLKKITLLITTLLLVFSCTKDDEPDVFILSVNISPATGGAVTPSGGTFKENKTVILNAYPASGYEFKEWAGDIQSTSNPLSLSMNADMDITAIFEIPSPIYLDTNGVTIKCYEWGEPGETGVIDGVVYTIVDETMLRDMVFNGEDITKVCTTRVTNMSSLFVISPFNGDIGSWDVSNVTDMSFMFGTLIGTSNRNPFNQDISNWDVSKVTNMWAMFTSSVFNQDISSWNVSRVKNMAGMFSNSEFNQPIGDWDVSSVTNMGAMFYNSQFNQSIGDWDVSKVTDMGVMFCASQLFNQDLSVWDVGSVVACEDFSRNTPQWVLPKPTFTNCIPN